MKVMWLDLETTGIDDVKHGIVELAYIIEIDKEEKERGSFKMNPFMLGKECSEQALEVNNLTEEEIKTYPSPFSVYSAFLELLDKYIDRFNPLDKFIMGGYNVQFDHRFLKQFFIDMGDKYFGSYFIYRTIDVFSIITFLNYEGWFPDLDSYRLTNIAYVLGTPIENAHTAVADIEMTRNSYYKLLEIIKYKTTN